MLLTHLGSCPVRWTYCVGGCPGGFVGGLATARDWPSRLLPVGQLGAVTWRGHDIPLSHVRILVLWYPRLRERRRVKLDERLLTKLINLILDACHSVA